MYLFKTKTNCVSTLFIDGYNIGDIILENIFIGVKFDKYGNLIAFITEEDKNKLKNIDYEHLILKAQKKAIKAIKEKDFSFFYNHPDIIDIVDKNNFSYYKKHLTQTFQNILNITYPSISINQFS